MTTHARDELRAAARGRDAVAGLLGSGRLWWRALEEAVRTDPGWLVSGEPAEIVAALAARTTGERIRDDATVLLAAARAAGGAAPELLAEDLGALCRRWRGGSLPRRLPRNDRPSAIAPDHPGLFAAMALLIQRPDSGPRTMAALTMAMLHGAGEDQGKPLVTHVLFDANPVGAEIEGAVGRLELVRLADGPGGLFPDPRYMSFFHGSGGFPASLDHAWAATFGDGPGQPCVLWRMTATEPDDGSPVAAVSGESAGAAFGVLLTELRRQRERPGGLRGRVAAARTLRGRVALTGAITDGGAITEVGGIGAKLTAAVRQHLDPILPRANQAEAAKVPRRSEPHWVDSVGAAHRRATQWPRAYRRIAIGAGTAAVLAVLASGTVYTVLGERAETARQEKIAARLTGAARDLRDRDPALAALLAAQALGQAPDRAGRAAAAEELIQQLADNGHYAGVVTGNNQRVTATAVAPAQAGGAETILAGTEDGLLFAADVSRRTVGSRQGRASDGAVTAIAVNPAEPSAFASAGADGDVRLWRLSNRRIIPDRTTAGGRHQGAVRSVAYSPDGALLAASDEEGWVWVSNAATGALVAEFQPHTALRTDPAAIPAVAFGPAGALYAGTASGLVLTVDYRRRTAARIALPNRGAVWSLAVVPGPGRDSRETRHLLLIGSEEGLADWNPVTREESDRFPAAGLSGPVRTLAVHGTTVAAGQSNRTHLLYYDALLYLQFLHAADTYGETLPGSAVYPGGIVTPVLGGGIRVWEHQRRPLVRTLGIGRLDDVGVDEAGVQYVLGNYGQLVRLAGGGRTAPDNPLSALSGLLAVPRTPDVPVIVVADQEGDTPQPIVAYDRTTMASVPLPDQDHRLAACEGVTAVAFLSGTPARLAVGCKSGLVQVWDPATWDVLTQTSVPAAQVTSFARLGDRLVIGGRPAEVADAVGTLTSGPVDNLDQPVTVHANRGGVTGLAVTDGRLVVGGADGSVRTYSPDLKPLTPAVTIGSTVRAVAAEAIGGRVVAAADQNLVLLDPRTMERLVTARSERPVLRLAPGGPDTVAAVLDQDGPPQAPDGAPAGQLWQFGTGHLVEQACRLGGRELTADEVRQYSGDARAEPHRQCPAARPAPATSGGPSAAPGAVLVPATGPVQDRISSGCDSLLTEGGRCDVLLGGEHDYAWTDVPGPAVPADAGNFAHRLVLYQGTVDGAGWRPVLRTADGWAGVDVYAYPIGPEGLRSIAVGHRRAGAVNGTALDLVTDGALERTLPAVAAARPTDFGIQIWQEIAGPDSWITYELRRDAAGRWTEHGRRPTTADDQPR
ncbi:S16 family serine protease [Paractinoplanes rishiriensis]|uniref:WD40 repeat protein n=1 Tax=Paractinoplanes rishiriensis TaxID=1050105 RepID=A0A919N000_9ACTN|nr:S16 family serine protease [Actinoplanes rishiriensis]GIE94462.1 hypothetical protein Ari01nite_19270 [Actinoplanes rishiriensis]